MSVGLTIFIIMETKKSRKQVNKEKVIKAALKFFSDNGIENSKVNDIAISAGVTERSAFRYFETKNDLVLATALLFRNGAVKEINKLCDAESFKNLSGIEQVEIILNEYANLFHTSKQELIFCAEAETYLNRCGKRILLEKRPPLKFEDSDDPLAKAIRKGVVDGTIKTSDYLEFIYLNTYDSMLGFIQKMALNNDNISENTAKIRIKLFIDSLLGIYKQQ